MFGFIKRWLSIEPPKRSVLEEPTLDRLSALYVELTKAEPDYQLFLRWVFGICDAVKDGSLDKRAATRAVFVIVFRLDEVPKDVRLAAHTKGVWIMIGEEINPVIIMAYLRAIHRYKDDLKDYDEWVKRVHAMLKREGKNADGIMVGLM